MFYQFHSYASDMTIIQQTGMRESIQTFRANPKTGKKRKEDAYIMIPTFTPDDLRHHYDALEKYLVQFIHAIQDGIIRTAYESGANQIAESQVDIPAILSLLEKQSQAAQRLSGKMIEDWFIASGLKQALAAVYEEQTGSLKKAYLLTDAFLKLLVSLASPKAYIKQGVRESLISKLSLVDDEMAAKLIGRLKAMDDQADDDLLDML